MKATGPKSNTEWKKWGEEDPLYGVASWKDKQTDGKSPWTDEDFYALGSSDWQDFLGQWSNYGINTHSCVEIGCGAGRITKHLAESFDWVYALDVSEGMISRAKDAVGSNVEFSLVDGLHIPLGDQSVTAVFSTHVLQHLDSVEDGFSYFREAFRVLKPGGTVMIHLPLYQFPRDPGKFAGAMQIAYGCFRKLDEIRANLKRRTGAKIMRNTPYPIRDLNLFIRKLGFKNIQLRLFQPTSSYYLYPFVFATK